MSCTQCKKRRRKGSWVCRVNGELVENYYGQLHFATAHILSVDSALPQYATRLKALDFLPKFLAGHGFARCLAISAVPPVYS